jgi:putative transposase
VLAADITYVPMSGVFMFSGLMDWNSRKVLSWRLSNTLDTEFCVAALEEAIYRFGTPEIFNMDQGARFTSKAFTNVLQHYDIKISMEGRGRIQDNIFIERLRWTAKHHYLYLHVFDNGTQLRNGINELFRFYNQKRFHQDLDNLTPDEVYYKIPYFFAEAA